MKDGTVTINNTINDGSTKYVSKPKSLFERWKQTLTKVKYLGGNIYINMYLHDKEKMPNSVSNVVDGVFIHLCKTMLVSSMENMLSPNAQRGYADRRHNWLM